jgi:predicted small integral membrane protein
MLEWMHWTLPSALGFGLLFATLGALAMLDRLVPSYPRKGFLPMETTRGDRVFLSVVTLLLVVFAWLRFAPEVSLWGAVATAAVIDGVTLRWG